MMNLNYMVKSICLCLLFILATTIAWSQCNVSTGVPIINETFGSGPNFGAPLPAGITNLQYITDNCPNDGYYTIASLTVSCYGGIWHTLTDHTGDPNGYFMLINASYQPSDFYLDTIKSLCPGTTYEFSAWIVNMYTVNGFIMPNVTFTIEKTDGTVLSSYNSGDIPVINPVTWTKYGFYFKTPAGVPTVVIRMHNNADGGIGNDLALDDIGFTPSGPQTTIETAGARNDTLYNQCFNKTITLSASIGSCYANNTYQWETSSDNKTWADITGATDSVYNFMVQNVGTTFYRLKVAESGNIENVTCRVNSNTFIVVSTTAQTQNIAADICFGKSYTLPSGKTVNQAGFYIDTAHSAQGCDSLITHLTITVDPPIRSVQNISICQGQSYAGHSTAGTFIDTLTNANGCDSIRTLNLSLNPLPTPNLGHELDVCFGDTLTLNPGTFSAYLWQDKSTLPYYKAVAPGTYWVKVYDQNDCEGTDTVNITMVNCKPIKIPNTFTPNNDGVNDTWKIAELTIYKSCTVQIFNRYGQLVFTSKGPYIPWNGKLNGKPVPIGTYYYIINVADTQQQFSGWLLLVR